MLNQKIVDTAESLRLASRNIPKIWDGRNAILEMKEGGSRHWKQTEWQGWYFQYCRIEMSGTHLSVCLFCISQLDSHFLALKE